MEKLTESVPKTKKPDRLLSRQSIESKLDDPDEFEKFTFVTNILNESPVWETFKIIEYCGLEQKFVKCVMCPEIFENEPNEIMNTLQKHQCSITVKTEINTEYDDSSSIEEQEEQSSSARFILTKPALQSAMADPDERHNVVLRAKESFKCLAWEHLDMVSYKGVSQPFAFCRYCRTLVSCSTKNGTSSIRKHVAKCSKIPRSQIQVVDEHDVDDENCDEDEDDDDCHLFIPEVVYDDPAPVVVDVKKEIPSDNNNLTLDCSGLFEDSDEEVVSNGTTTVMMDKFRLQELYDDPVERPFFVFERPRKNDDAAYWKIFEYVIYRGIRQKYCKCTQCGVYINFVSTRRRGLARHMRSCNKKFSPIASATPPNNSNKKTLEKPKSTNKSTPTKTTTTPNKPRVLKQLLTSTPSTSATMAQSPQLAAALQSVQSPQLAAALQSPPTPQSVSNPKLPKRISPPADFRNHLLLNQLSFLATDLQSLDFIESSNFRNFAQNLITLGAEYGAHRIDEILTTKENLLKWTIPAKLSKMKRKIKEIISDEPHLNFTIDLYENKHYDKLNFKYFLTISCCVITDTFVYKTFTLGTKEFPEAITAEDITMAFVKITSEYYDKENLTKRCYVVTNDHDLLVKAFKDYTRLPSITHNLRDIFNNMLFSDDISPEIVENVKKIEKLFAYLKINYNYYSNSESLIDQIEEFYELHETLKKLLKEKGDLDRLTEISRHMMKTVINFMELLKLCLETLDDKSATVNAVLLWKKKLMEHYTPVLHEHKLTEDLKRKTIALLETEFNTDYDLYKIALFLNPNFKSLKILSPVEREQVHTAAREMIQEIIDAEKQQQQQTSQETVSMKIEKDDVSPAKRIKVEENVFAKFQDNPRSTTNGSKKYRNIEMEIAKYSSDTKVYLTCDDLLEFWYKCKSFPNLRKLAKKILSIPTCSNGLNETVLLKANRSYREVYGQSLTVDEFHSVIFLNRNFELLEHVD